MGEIERLASRGLPRLEFFGELTARLHQALECDATCWHTLDPQTLMITSDAPDELVTDGIYTAEELPVAGELLVRSEYVIDDFISWASLAGRRVPVASLGEATNGKPKRSARYRDLLEPAGIPFELRATFVHRGRAWGAVEIVRREDKHDFTERDRALLGRLVPAIGDGIRESVRADAARRAQGPGGPGLVVVAPNDEVELISEPGFELLELMRPSVWVRGEETLPAALLALAAIARHQAQDGVDRPSWLPVPTADGWLTLHASLPEPRSSGRVAIVIERARGNHVAPLRLEAYRLTARERELATLLVRGLSHKEIAAQLFLSPHTVRDHVKSIYEKTAVGNRRDFVARVFLEDYVPQLADQAPVGSDGRFEADSAA